MKTRNYNYDRKSLKEIIKDIRFDIGQNNYLRVTTYLPEVVKSFDWYDGNVVGRKLDVKKDVNYYRTNGYNKTSDLLSLVLDGFESAELSKKSLKRINKFLWNFQNKSNTHRYLKLIRFISYVNNKNIKIDFDGKELEIQKARKAYREAVDNLKKDHLKIMKEKKESYLKVKGDYYKKKF